MLNQNTTKSQVKTWGRASMWIVDADVASRVSTTAVNKFVPLATMQRKVQAKTVAITTAVNQTTPFNPRLESSAPTITSYNHSQAIQGLPAMMEE